MAEQKAKARAAGAGSGEAADEAVWFDLALEERDDGVPRLRTRRRGEVLALVVGGEPVETAPAGEVELVLNLTPFYAESGGQVGDTGTLRTDRRVASPTAPEGRSRAPGRVEEGEPVRGAAADRVDHDRRTRDPRGPHGHPPAARGAAADVRGARRAARQPGGAGPAALRLRAPEGDDAGGTGGIEAEVNAYVRQNTPVETRIMPPEAAEKLGARALFGEKYGDEVRGVAMGARERSGLGAHGDTYSLELCGGTHVAPHRRHWHVQAGV